jgi:hypothetical protein
MADQVKITSLDVLETFRSRLIVFLTKARRAVDEATDDARRTRNWLHGEQKVFWEAQWRKRRKAYDAAQQELISARFSEFNDSPSLQQAAVRKTKAALDEAEDKMRKVKAWSRDFDRCAEPVVKKLEGMKHYIEHDLPMAVALLTQIQRTLEAYSETHAPSDAPAPSSGGESPESLPEPTEPSPP